MSAATANAAAAGAGSPKAGKGSRSKSGKKAPSHPTYSAMIRKAVTELKDKSGSSKAAILKYLLAHYKLGDNIAKVNSQLRVALKKSVMKGELKQVKEMEHLEASDSERRSPRPPLRRGARARNRLLGSTSLQASVHHRRSLKQRRKQENRKKPKPQRRRLLRRDLPARLLSRKRPRSRRPRARRRRRLRRRSVSM
ncbi:hypothetical protein KIN20_035214 [Parelaphostrongylus tenuis]|uniref:H15 domain-containing protein n=1 Tax=Parelaphostrongylus tenuis TaxID=148309 RepID=A0AAD5WJI2_PARTN|nr:hypothetical protein KIN20_035214 [Parelaphostrongylus tenuis]